MTAQATIFLDTLGNPHCELPGINGARRTLELPSDFAARNPELMAELQSQQAEIELAQRRKNATDLIARTDQRIKPVDLPAYITSAEQNKIRMEQAELAWKLKYESATACEKMTMDFKKALADERSNRIKKIRTHDLYIENLKRHGIQIANRVVPDKQRRPSRKVNLGNGRTYNPKTDKITDPNERKRTQRFKGSANGQVVKITL